ncbi:MAG: amidohydrolase family protein [Desulfomonilaceae bacterium]
MMRIDAHLHVNFCGLGPKRLIEYLDSNRFDCCWLLTWEEISPGKWPYQHLSVDEVFECYVKYPSRIIPFYAPDPHRANAGSAFLNYYRNGFRGYGELKATLSWASPQLRSILDVLRDTGVPVLFHMEESSHSQIPLDPSSSLETFLVQCMRTSRLGGWTGKLFKLLSRHYNPVLEWMDRRTSFFPGYMLDIAELELILLDYPTINFIGHGPLFWKHISATVERGGPVYPPGPVQKEGQICRLLRSYPNIFADISAGSGFNALSRDKDFSRTFLDELNGKVLFGSDNATLGHEDLLKSFGLSKNVLNRIMGETAARLIPPNVIS